MTWYVNEQIGLSGDYVWSTLGGKDDWPGLVASRPVDVTPRIQFGTISVRFQGPPAKARLYALAGVGLYRRTVAMATTGSGDITVCDPWWFVCTAGPVPVGSVNRTRSSSDVGINVGAGIIGGRFFAEIRYHYMWGPSFDTPGGTQKAPGSSAADAWHRLLNPSLLFCAFRSPTMATTTRRVPALVSSTLLVLGVALTVLGVVLMEARHSLLTPEGLSMRAGAALADPRVSAYVADRATEPC